jgi:hypothetical protein
VGAREALVDLLDRITDHLNGDVTSAADVGHMVNLTLKVTIGQVPCRTTLGTFRVRL